MQQDLPLLDPEHKQWKRRRLFIIVGAVIGACGFIASIVALFTSSHTSSVGFAWASAGLFASCVGLHHGSAWARNRILGRGHGGPGP